MAERVKALEYDYDNVIIKQQEHLPILMNRKVFKNIDIKITHFAIEKLIAEWAVMTEWSKAIERKQESEPEGEDECLLNCRLPKQFGLSCKCFLYACYVAGDSIPMSLIHPRCLFDAKPVLIE